MPVDKTGPIAAAARAFAPERPPVVGVAVSGGGDSLALLHLMLRAAPQTGWRVEAATVDHGLRPEAADEARSVAALCRDWNIPHQVLLWTDPHGTGNLMDRARRARLRLLAEWATGRGIAHVALGHTADDQAETLLMGLSRAAGVDGLSGMRPVFTQDGIMFARPLLHLTRQSLRDHLTAQGIGWIDDPSNENDAFARVRARRALRALKPMGITAAKLAAVTDHLDMARAALDAVAAAAARRIWAAREGALFLDRAAFLAEPAEIRRRLVLSALRWMTGAGYPPRESELDRLLWALAEGRDATLRGTLTRARGDQALVRREYRAVAALTSPPGALWDGRWRIHGPWQGDEEIRALGPAGLRECPDWRGTGLPRGVLEVAPAIWRGTALLAAPSAGFGRDWTATCAPVPFPDQLSH